MSDRLHDIRGVQTPTGQRQVQVRIVTDSDGAEWQLHEMHIIRPNGDWDYIDSVNADEAMRWLIGETS